MTKAANFVLTFYIEGERLPANINDFVMTVWDALNANEEWELQHGDDFELKEITASAGAWVDTDG